MVESPKWGNYVLFIYFLLTHCSITVISSGNLQLQWVLSARELSFFFIIFFFSLVRVNIFLYSHHGFAGQIMYFSQNSRPRLKALMICCRCAGLHKTTEETVTCSSQSSASLWLCPLLLVHRWITVIIKQQETVENIWFSLGVTCDMEWN